MDFVMEKEALVAGTSNGHLLLYNVDDNATETVGRVEGGVKCISPSPDGDLLAVVTGFGQILVMTHDWDLLYETSIEEPTEEIDVIPTENKIKVNTDAAIFDSSNCYSYSFVAKDHSDELVEAQSRCARGVAAPEVAEPIGTEKILAG
ncbi:hypothetical protein POM88_033497 [Heracleum sosnowskyi]|uniref:Elongator complex protein 1 n=1 Tax=Heracleum sosnowskyi TaxID=360622 RepID=A0AAD8I193_9APIA|nr:hypothetical protein POM88_033497 [Heracleum sosnowskyi]